MGKKCQIPRTLPMSQKLEPLLLKSQRPHQRKIRSEKIKMRIEAAIASTEVARATATQVTALAAQDLIVQQTDENATLIPDTAVYHTISASAILH